MNAKTGFGSLSGNLHILDAPSTHDVTGLTYANSEHGSFPSTMRTFQTGMYPIQEKSKVSVLNIIATCVLIFAFIFITLSFFCPFWIGFDEPWIERLYVPPEYRPVKNKAAWSGLLFSCDTENVCRSGTDNTTSWHKVCQILFGAGFVLILLAFLIQISYLCCKCRNNLSLAITIVVAVLITVATILCGISIGTYSGSSLSDGILTPLSVGGVGGTLAWAFYLGIAGVAIGGLAALMFFVDICLQLRTYSSYDPSPEKIAI